MRITFVVPSLNLTGGIRVVSIYAKLLAERGHIVTIVSPGKKLPTLKEKIKAAIKWKGYTFKSVFNRSFFDNVNYDLKLLDAHRPVTSDDVPDADIIIATFWDTAEWIAPFPDSKGTKAYFIQHYETHPWLPIERVKATFKLPFKKIVVAQWLADIIQDEYQQEDVAVIANGVDHQLFYSPIRQKNIRVKYGMMYSNRSYKGSQLALECFSQLQKSFPSVQLIAFGLENPEEVVGLPLGAEYYCRPEQNKIRDIYSQCDAWLFTSTSEGFGLPILEAMSCRTPVIGTVCGAAPELLSSGGGLLVEVNNRDQLVTAMTSIYDMDADKWFEMSTLAFNEAQCHRWETAVGGFEQVLLEAAYGNASILPVRRNQI